MAGADDQPPADPGAVSCSERAQEKLEMFYGAFAAQGKERPQGWSCTARPRHSGKSAGTLDFVYTSPLNTPYRSRVHAWQACGLAAASQDSKQSASKPYAKRKRTESSPSSAHYSQAEQSTAAVNQPPVPVPQPAVAANMPFSSGRERLGAMSPIPQAPDAVPLDSLTEADLKARNLLEIPIRCKVKMAKAGVFYPAQMQVRCVEVGCLECEGKSGADRMMRPSGKFSFEEHCGRPRNQHQWRQSFKVQRPGSEGRRLDRFFADHRINMYSKSASIQHPAAVAANGIEAGLTAHQSQQQQSQHLTQGVPGQQQQEQIHQRQNQSRLGLSRSAVVSHSAIKADPDASFNAEVGHATCARSPAVVDSDEESDRADEAAAVNAPGLIFESNSTRTAQAEPADADDNMTEDIQLQLEGLSGQVQRQDDTSAKRRYQRQLKIKDKLLAGAAAEVLRLNAVLSRSPADLESMHAVAAASTDKAIDQGLMSVGAQQQLLELESIVKALRKEAAQHQVANSKLQTGVAAKDSKIAELEQQLIAAQQDTQQQKARAAAMYLELQQDSQQEVLKLKSQIFDLKMRGHG